MKYIYIPKWNLAIATTPKCGSTSIFRAIQDEFGCTDVRCTDKFPLLSTNQVLTTMPVLFVVRHPLDRFLSMWRQRTTPGYDSPSGTTLHGKTPRQLWEGRDEGDDHWKTQTQLLGKLREQATIVRLEDLYVYWRHMTSSTVEIPRVNVTGTQWPEHLDYRLIRRIERFYADDIEMYNGAVKWVS